MRFLSFILLSLLVVSHAVAQDTCDFDTLLALTDDAACSELAAGEVCSAEGVVPMADGITAPAWMPLTDDLTAWLIGGASMTIDVAEASVQLEASNGNGYNVNLRSGPGTNYEQAGVFAFSETALADGRNADGSWVRLSTDDGLVWIASRLVTLDGDIISLPVVAGNEPAAVTTISLLGGACDGLSGLLLTYTSETPFTLQIHDNTVRLSDTTVWLTVADDTLQLLTLTGSVETDATTPLLTVADAELSTLQQLNQLSPLAQCLVSADTGMTAYDSPDTESDVSYDLQPDMIYSIDAQSMDAEWLRVVQDGQEAWVQRAELMTIGDCANLIEIDDSAPTTTTVSTPQGDPADVMYAYFQARIDANVAQMQTLSCASWDSTAVIQAQTFRSMNAELSNVACSTVSNDGASATVYCSGSIVTYYEGEPRSWALGNFRVINEGGQWRMCGEA